MSVYVDEPVNKYSRMIMCHMIADTLKELHHMADTIGIQRKWFQCNSKYLHYDICKSKRTLALKNGAISMTTKELVLKLQEQRNNQ